MASQIVVGLLLSRSAALGPDQCAPFATSPNLCVSGKPVLVENATREDCCALLSSHCGGWANGHDCFFNYFASNFTCHIVKGYTGTYACPGEVGYPAPAPAPPTPPPGPQCSPFAIGPGACYVGQPVHVQNGTREECCALLSSRSGSYLFNYFASNSTCNVIEGYSGTYPCPGELGYNPNPSPTPTPPQPSLTGNILYHLFEPKFTGLANKDGGDFQGDMGFIFGTFQDYEAGNPEASMEHNIIEMSEVNVTGWGKYEECNAPGAVGQFTCPNGTEYCCTTGYNPPVPTNHSSDQLPGLEASKMSLGWDFGFAGWWFSFPKESQGNTWSEKVLRRISGKCVGDAWRIDAGGCPGCGDKLDACVADCIKGALAPNGSTTLLRRTWDRVFASPNECPDVPFPAPGALIV